MWFLQIRRGAVALVFDEPGWDVFLQWVHPCRLHLVPILRMIRGNIFKSLLHIREMKMFGK
jgi:hypothetical protein